MKKHLFHREKEGHKIIEDLDRRRYQVKKTLRDLDSPQMIKKVILTQVQPHQDKLC
jgi:ABC-type Fe3+-hydroxamate transport system substrate-binding protein